MSKVKSAREYAKRRWAAFVRLHLVPPEIHNRFKRTLEKCHDYDMTFCVSPSCPYINSCDRSAKMLEGLTGIFSFADFSGTCRDYIAHVVDQVEQGVSGDG